VGTISRIALESLVLKYRYVLHNLAKVAAREVKTLHILGGGTRNTLLNQLTADATNLPVVTGPVEATAIGNIMMQAYGKGDYKSLKSIRECVKESFDVQEYRPQNTKAWDDRYQQFLKII
jgi:sugar (pentulose or hexulose) kinase